jgi:hypothetical protein
LHKSSGCGNRRDTNSSVFHLRIQTNRGDIPTPILFKEGTVPTLNITAGGTPATGNTGSVDGNVSFRAFTSDGQPALFVGLPATLEFTLTSVDSTGSDFDSTKFSTPPDYTLITSGGVATSGSSVSTGSAITNVLIFQVQPKDSDPTDQTILGTTVPAADFTDEVDGKSYPADFDVDLTGGFLTIPTPPGFSATGSSSNNGNSNSNSNSNSNNNSDTDFASSDTTFIPVFSGSDDESLENVFSTEYQPSSGTPIAQGSDDTGSGQVYQVGNNYYVTVGLSSRVWPGLIGVTQTPSPTPTTSPTPSPTQAIALPKTPTVNMAVAYSARRLFIRARSYRALN